MREQDFSGYYARDDGWSGAGRRDEYVRGGEVDYTGLGPCNYRRSDERITEDVCERLTDDRDVDATDVDVRVEDGDVFLTGRVRSRCEKRRAEDVAMHCRGVHDVVNELSVEEHV